MKKRRNIVLLITILFCGCFNLRLVKADVVIQDAFSEDMIKALNIYSSNGILTDDIIKMYTNLYINEKINDFKGLELLTELTEIHVEDLETQTIDWNLSNLKKLKYISIENNIVTENIHIINPNVETVSINGLSKLKTLDISKCSNLKSFYSRKTLNLSSLSLPKSLNLIVLRGSEALKNYDFSTFTNLEYLDVSSPYNYYGTEGRIFYDEFDASKLVNLKYLAMNEVGLKNLILPENSKIETLRISGNKLKSLDTINMPNLKELDVNQNSLTSLDLSKNLSLEILNASRNQLQKMDFSKNENLVKIDISNNEISNINILNKTKLLNLNLSYNNLETMDLTGNNALEKVYLTYNKLRTVKLPNSNFYVNIYYYEQNIFENYNWYLNEDTFIAKDSNLTSSIECLGQTLNLKINPPGLDVKKYDKVVVSVLEKYYPNEIADGVLTEEELKKIVSLTFESQNVNNWPDLYDFKYLKTLMIKNTNFSYINLPSSVTKLIVIGNNNLDSLYLNQYRENKPNLKEIIIENNLNLQDLYLCETLEKITLNGNPKVESLNIYAPKLNALNIANNENLKSFTLSAGTLTKLDLRDNPILDSVEITGNELESLLMPTTIKKLTISSLSQSLNNYDFSSYTNLEKLSITGMKMKQLNLNHMVNLKTLSASQLGLSLLDVTQNRKLESLNISYNNLTNINLSNNPNLLTLEANNNHLKTLDLSKNTKLTTITLNDNQLTTLDLSHNVKLIRVNLDNPDKELTSNPLSTIKLPNTNKNVWFLLNNRNKNDGYYWYTGNNLYDNQDRIISMKGQTLVYRKKVTSTTPFGSTTSITISSNFYNYTGKNISPTVVVRQGTTVLKNGVDYKLSYKNNKNIGTATISVTGIGKYSGTKTRNFNIILGNITGLQIKNQTATSIGIKWKKVIGATGYVIYISTNKNGPFTKISATKGSDAVEYIKTNLKAATTYYFRVRAYKTTDGKNIYNDYTTIKGFTSPIAPVISGSIVPGVKKATINWNRVTGANAYEIYMSTDKNSGYTKVGTTTKNNAVTFTKTSLTTGQVYYFKIRAISIVDGKKIYGSYSTVKAVRAK